MRLFTNSKLNLPVMTLVAVLGILGAYLVGGVGSPAARAQAPKAAPKKKDSSDRLKPKEISFTTEVSPTEVKAGGTVSYKVSAKIKPTWHIYKFGGVQPEPGPRNTAFDFFDTAGLKPEGDWTPSREPTRQVEPAFPDIPFLEFYENDVTWTLTLKVPPGTPPGERTLRCQIYFSLCNPQGCKSPAWVTVPDSIVTVLAGDAGAEAAAPPSTPPPPATAANQANTASTAAAAQPDAALAAHETVAPLLSDRLDGGPQTAARGPLNQVEKSLQQGVWPFVVLAMTGGLLALVMPCVWPMVPITVNFFVKQGEKDKRKTVVLAITYFLTIIGIFTLVGVLFSAIFGASSLQRLANSAWLNILVSILFLAFGLSLLGLFEIRLPNALLNLSSRGESHGGLIGVVFMALTLTITSFTCTFPVVGGLLVMAAGGSYFYPVLGLAVFATVLGLPFLLLALAPGLLSRMPRSGDWMNTVKVVGGLAEIGAAFKFINTAEIAFVTPEDAWVDAQVVLGVWVVLSLVCGIYLLGVFRTDHDHDAVKVGPGRILIGSAFLFLGLYMSPALFGRPPESQLYSRLIVGLLPPDAYRLSSSTGSGSGGESSSGVRRVLASSPVPEVAIEQEKTIINGVTWGMSYETALAEAKKANEPVLIDFTGVNCANCRLMERNVLPRPEVVSLLKKFKTIELYTDYVPIKSITSDQRYELAEKNQERLADLASESTNPFYVALTPSGEVLATIAFSEPAAFVKFLDKALTQFQAKGQVAQADASVGR